MDSWIYNIAPHLEQALHARDGRTAQHCRRVARLAVRLGEMVNLERHDLLVVAVAARLHDIGKIELPDSILHKPGPLDDAEWAVMRTHSVLGEGFILSQRDIPFREEIARVVRHHHEHWDGSGYPDGLRGEEIPLLSRIVSVADSHDAMTSGRSYHPGRTHATVKSILAVERGVKHDPAMLDTLLADVVR
ncbi:MAG: HD domain-containing protein [Xanthomonadaceae bacterium]|jgi:putative nucleotidyltransferase with HDIG domain|nr:HD domain-containing protein [Xanthomonadaceae bacterium]